MTDDVPVRLVKRKTGCANRLIEVFLDDIEEPGGAQVSNFIVVAPRRRTAALVTGVAVLPVVDGKFALLRIYRHPIRDYVWEVPRGFVDEGEEARASALRELEEETGLKCDPHHVVDLGTIVPEPGIIAARTQLFAATQCRRTAPYSRSEMGHRELSIFSARETADMAREGAIQEANTLVAWYRYSLSRA